MKSLSVLPALSCVLLLEAAPDAEFLEEPGYVIERLGEQWLLKKPRLQIVERSAVIGEAWPIFADSDRATVEQQRDALPRVRLDYQLVSFNPLTRGRTLITDWTGAPDAQEIGADVRAILNRFAPAAAREVFSSAPIFMARLSGALGHTAEEPNDHRRFVIYIDPFAATSRLHAASTLVHELAHLERYRSRGFHANRAAAVLPKHHFLLLGVADEMAGFQAEAVLVEGFLNNTSTGTAVEAARNRMVTPTLRWPKPVTLLLGFEGPSRGAERDEEARRQILVDLHQRASRYWDMHYRDKLDPALETTIRNWYRESAEWKRIEVDMGEGR